MDAKGVYEVTGLFPGSQFITSVMLDVANVLDLCEGAAISCLQLLCFSICIFPTSSVVTWLDNLCLVLSLVSGNLQLDYEVLRPLVSVPAQHSPLPPPHRGERTARIPRGRGML